MLEPGFLAWSAPDLLFTLDIPQTAFIKQHPLHIADATAIVDAASAATISIAGTTISKADTVAAAAAAHPVTSGADSSAAATATITIHDCWKTDCDDDLTQVVTV